MNISQNGTVILREPNFNISHIFECGQCFRWNRCSSNSFVGIANNKILKVEQEQNEIRFINVTKQEFEYFWKEYFDLNRDYTKIKNILRQDKVLDKAINFGWGIRILKQDFWECLISFIISANNRIPMIKKSVDNISKLYGERLLFEGKEYFSFPTPNQLEKATIEQLEKCGVGFRAKYIISTINMVLSGKFNIEQLYKMDTSSAREKLQELPGVGPKIADCVLLFSLERYDVFPTDVWVKRVMEYFYSEDGNLKLNQIQSMAKELFGHLAGFAQQYLFYYARELKLGR